MKNSHFVFIFILSAIVAFSQNRKQYKVYYDIENSQIKEQYHTLYSDSTVLDGLYKTYYQDGKVKTVGFYTKGQATDYWEYFYQNGNLKMEGLINNFFNQGHWIFYHETGIKSMEGSMDKGKKNGFWRFYTEEGKIKSEGNILNDKNSGFWKYYQDDGELKATARYSNGTGIYTEYYPDATIKMQGKIINGKSDSTWTYFHPNGNVKSTGNELNGLKEGNWIFYHTNGKQASEGQYNKGQTIGNWKYYFENGNLNAEGAEKEGKRDGHWLMYTQDGKPKAEGFYTLGSGEYIEYHANGKIKAKGNILNGKHDGMWNFYQENSFFKVGDCNYTNGEGWYMGYFPEGGKKTEGMLKNGVKTGVWKLYKKDGTLAGYYKTSDSDEELPIPSIVQKKTTTTLSIKIGAAKKKQGFFSKIHLYRPDPNVYKTFIVSMDPIQFLSGAIPISIEYYVQKKWGLELIFTYFRNPFFSNASKLADREVFSEGQGYAIRYKKYFSNSEFIGNPYIGAEYRHRRLSYNSKDSSMSILNKEILTVAENGHEILLVVGDRFVKSNAKGGPTLDIYLGIGLGYKFAHTNFISTQNRDAIFGNILKNGWYIPFRFGVSIGWAF